MDKEEVIKGLEICIDPMARRNCNGCPFVHAKGNCIDELQSNAIAMLKEQNEKIERYEYFLKVLGLEFKEWDALLKEGKAEVISTLDETDRKATVTFQLFDYE